jgi:hypothetical protein
MVSLLQRIQTTKVLLLLVAGSFVAKGQNDIPPGTWRMHFSYNHLNAIVVTEEAAYGAAEGGVMRLDKSDYSITTITGINGLVGAGPTAMAFYSQKNLLLIGHDDGNVTLIQDGTINLFDRLSTSNSISGSKKINHIYLSGALAYVSADFGIVTFDLNQLEVKETYRDLGLNGVKLKINEAIVFNDSIFAATELGVIGGSLSATNLLDYRNWKRYDQEDLAQDITSITTFNNNLYVAIDLSGIYMLENGAWVKQVYLDGESLVAVSGNSNGLLISTGNSVFEVDAGNEIYEVSSGLITEPSMAIRDDSGRFWVADKNNGLVSDVSGTFESFKPNGPSSNLPWRLVMDDSDLINIHGGYNVSRLPSGTESSVNIFSNGQWSTKTTGLPADISDFISTGGVEYVSSFGHGLEQISSTGSIVFDETNSPLTNANPPGRNVFVTSIAGSFAELWVANYDSDTPLHLLKEGQQWESFVFPIVQTSFPQEIEVDADGRVWMLIDPTRGGGVFVYDNKQQQSVYLSNGTGQGGLPVPDVRSIAFDRDGQVWLGTSQGVAYFTSPGSVFNTPVDAILPIYENRFLLRDETVTSIAIDGGNRKWMGTKNGAWLFDAHGEKLIYNFNTDNSPLPSNHIADIAVNNISGEVFFSTDRGLVSFRSDATSGAPDFQHVKVFPNPVTRDFGGMVTINGLYTDARVKITDIAGHLIWETRANGGTASWNVRQLNGSRVGTGMYLIFSSTEDGAEKHVGKIAVID